MVKGGRPSREDYYRALASELPQDALVVTALGNASYLWATLHHRPENFYVEDAMGLALPLAVGLALAQPGRRVVVVEGDGGLLMHLGALVTLGAAAPKNLTVLLIDNGVHAASGGQALTNPALDFTALARASAIDQSVHVATPAAFADALRAALARGGPHFIVLAAEPDLEVVSPPIALDPVVTKHRFMGAIGALRYVPKLFGGGRLASD
ncbi:MAG: hypothetical protein IT515_07545 [Burkholderiales bacterium]|nr:hypothetical protein [Burkholderiales bacterium]